MTEIAYTIGHTPQIAKEIAQTLSLPITDSGYTIDNDVLKGTVEFYQLDEKLSIQISKFEPFTPIKVCRKGTTDDELLILDFHISGIASLNIINGIDQKNTINGLTHGAYFASSDIESFATFPEGFVNEQFHIVMHKSWLQHFFSSDIHEVLENISISAPFFIYERTNSEITTLLINIFKSDHNASFRKRYLHGKTLELLAVFFKKLKNRQENLKYKVSNYKDIATLFDFMQYVDEHLNEDLSVQRLAQKIGFSESKLQQLCKAVYGNSVSKEITARRMIRALELLGEQKYTIAEIGYQMGYQNMSHFANAFKRIHGFLPSQYLK